MNLTFLITGESHERVATANESLSVTESFQSFSVKLKSINLHHFTISQGSLVGVFFKRH